MVRRHADAGRPAGGKPEIRKTEMTMHPKELPLGRRLAHSSSVDRPGEAYIEPLDPKLTAILMASRRQFLRFLQSRLGDRDEAEDVLQDFHMRVLTKASQIRDTGSTMAWLRAVLKSVLADHFRRQTAERHARQLMVTDWLATSTEQEMTPAEEEGFERTACSCFYKLLPTLKREYADALVRIDLMQEPREDVARALGITVGNMRVRLHRARRALKETLKRSCQRCRAQDCFGQCGSPGGPERQKARSACEL
tara:strand:- start:1536 stop:2291 length:756 start_codon:yes stop_codon:yes gene_type:complete